MKKITLALCLMAVNAFANNIPQSILDNVATDIDNICGDTWCEGDFDWNHYNMKCDLTKGQCSIDLTLIASLEEYGLDKSIADIMVKNEGFHYDSDEGDLLLTYGKTCILKGINSVEDVAKDNGYSSYSDKVYNGVMDCVSAMEDVFYALEEKANAFDMRLFRKANYTSEIFEGKTRSVFGSKCSLKIERQGDKALISVEKKGEFRKTFTYDLNGAFFYRGSYGLQFSDGSYPSPSKPSLLINLDPVSWDSNKELVPLEYKVITKKANPNVLFGGKEEKLYQCQF